MILFNLIFYANYTSAKEDRCVVLEIRDRIVELCKSKVSSYKLACMHAYCMMLLSDISRSTAWCNGVTSTSCQDY